MVISSKRTKFEREDPALAAAKAEAIATYHTWLDEQGIVNGWTTAMTEAGKAALSDAVNAMTTIEEVNTVTPGYQDYAGTIWNDVVKPAIVAAS